MALEQKPKQMADKKAISPVPCVSCVHFCRCGHPIWTYCKTYNQWRKEWLRNEYK